MKLNDLPLFFLDLQTTGATPAAGHILEIAMSTNGCNIENYLIALPEGQDIPRRIQLLTGIQQEDMSKAITLEELKKKFKKYQDKICIIHYAQFEKPFLAHALSDKLNDVPFQFICTHEIAKRLYPNIPSRGIKALAGFFGHGTGDFKRSKCHVLATIKIWSELIKALAEKDIHTLDELKAWLEKTPKLPRTKLEYPLPKEKRLELPDSPGIYRMKNKNGDILYIGKATSLHHRVNSYFRGQKKRDAKKLEMLAQVYDIETTICKSPLHAALLETDEIKKINPYYNIALKTNDRLLYFFNKDFSSVTNTPDENHHLGPFSSLLPLESTLKLNQFMQNEETLPLPSPDLFFELLDHRLIKDGIDEFLNQYQIPKNKLCCYRQILAIGIRWLKKNAQITEEIYESEEEPEDEKEELSTLSASDIADKLKRHFTRAAGAYLRAKKIDELTNATILFSEAGKASMRLEIKNGEILEESSAAPANSTWLIEPIKTYDRMSVLLTELEKIRTQGGQWAKIK